VVGIVLAAAIAPFIWYYEMWDRLGLHLGTWHERFVLNLFNVNEYLVPAAVVLAVLLLISWRGKAVPLFERRVLATGAGS
jgi:hypothetical protein